MNTNKNLKGIWEVLKNTFQGFLDDKILKLSGSLAFSTVFSMGPLLVVLISLCSIFLGREAAEGNVYKYLEAFMGHDAAFQLQDVVKKAAISGQSHIAIFFGIVILFIGATSVFAEIQDSINDIWGIKPKPKKSWLKIIQNRLISFSVVVSLVFLLLVSLTITSLIDGFSNHLKQLFPDVAVTLFYIFNQMLTFVVITLIFGTIYKVLPDARIKWKDILLGAVISALLFMIGKFAVSLYISKSNIGSTYGAAGSLIVLLLWIYYSSLILYLGAEFTKSFAVKYGSTIHPNDYAVTTKKVEIETGKKTVQEKEQNT